MLGLVIYILSFSWDLPSLLIGLVVVEAVLVGLLVGGEI
jgi:hypothetical protein